MSTHAPDSTRTAPATPSAPVPAPASTPVPAPASRTGSAIGSASAVAPVPAVEVDPGRWPGVARVPRTSSVRRTITRAVVGRALAALPLRVAYGTDAPRGATGPLLRLRDPEAFHRRIGADGLIGFGESYMAGEWETDDLVGVLTVLAAHVGDLVPRSLQRLRGVWARRHPAGEANTLDGAKDNIQRHYDLSNDLFALFLDETMTYSSAVFDDPATAVFGDLPSAQRRKIDRLLDRAGVTEGTRLLEIGTGWGELALRAAERGATVLTVTLSHEQRRLAMERIAAAGHADRVTVELRDYREVEGRFDAVVSVEMIEAVGEEYWPVYFDTLDRLTEPGGRVAIQAITMPHDRMLATRTTYTWIHKYIFPGGMIPSTEAIAQVTAHTRLRLEDDAGFGADYARTLALWRERFTAHAPAVDALGFDHVFRRMWEFYLAYSEAGFAAGYLDVRQLTFTASGTAREPSAPASPASTAAPVAPGASTAHDAPAGGTR